MSSDQTVNVLLFKSWHVFINCINWFILPYVLSSRIRNEADTAAGYDRDPTGKILLLERKEGNSRTAEAVLVSPLNEEIV